MTSDGKPYGPIRYEELVKYRYIISKNCNTSYLDAGKLTPTERDYILGYLVDEAKRREEMRKKFEDNNKKG